MNRCTQAAAMNRCTRFARFLFICNFLTLAACATAPSSFDQYQSTIQQFQVATDNTSAVTLEFILDLNNFERRLEIERLRADPARVLDLPNNFIANKFDPKAIATRAQAFQVIKNYTNMLAMLADSDAESRWVEATGALKSSVDQMTSSIEGGSNYSSALTEIANFAGKNWINGKRSKALDEAIISVSPAIEEISALISQDLETVVNQRITAMNIPLIELVGEYEAIQSEQASGAREAKRNKKLDELVKVLAGRDATLATLNGLQRTMQAFDAAHAVLVKYAKSDKGPQDVSDLVVVVNRYSALADSLMSSFAKS